ncbi:MAG: acetyltransferase [Flavobacterium sp.]|nr:MAG: acetyltransferase [Flavobacterium sp.]
MKDIAIYGAGGFGKEVACILHRINDHQPSWALKGFFDDGIEKGNHISHFGNILGGIEELNNWGKPIAVAFAIGTPHIIKKIVEKIKNPLVEFPNIVHPDVFFADKVSFRIGKGNVIVRACSFSCDVEIGDFNQFNSISALAHDVKVGSFNVFMPLTRISGGGIIGDLNLFGIGSVLLQNVRVGNNTRIAAGSYVMRKTQDGYLYMGNPAKKFQG